MRADWLRVFQKSDVKDWPAQRALETRVMTVAMPIQQRPNSARRMDVPGASLQLLPGASYAVRVTPSRPRIGFAFETQRGMHAFGSDRLKAFQASANSMAYTPSGCDIVSHSETGGEYLIVEFTDPLAQLDSEQFTGRVIPQSIDVARLLRRWLLQMDPVDPLETEYALGRLKASVFECENATDGAIEPRRWMTTRRLKIIEDEVEARLDMQVSVETLARALGLSSGFFSRAFKQATGKPPHDYIIERRLARARLLISTSEQSFAEIASACGYASQAHLTSQMRQRLGLTPGVLREQSRNEWHLV